MLGEQIVIGGWYCTRCQVWVSNNVSHSCPSEWSNTVTTVVSNEDTQLLREIRDLLKRLVAARVA